MEMMAILHIPKSGAQLHSMGHKNNDNKKGTNNDKMSPEHKLYSSTQICPTILTSIFFTMTTCNSTFIHFCSCVSLVSRIFTETSILFRFPLQFNTSTLKQLSIKNVESCSFRNNKQITKKRTPLAVPLLYASVRSIQDLDREI